MRLGDTNQLKSTSKCTIPTFKTIPEKEINPFPNTFIAKQLNFIVCLETDRHKNPVTMIHASKTKIQIILENQDSDLLLLEFLNAIQHILRTMEYKEPDPRSQLESSRRFVTRFLQALSHEIQRDQANEND